MRPYFNRGRGFKKIAAVGIQTARGGQNVEVTATDGSHYMITLSYSSNTLATNVAEGQNGQNGVATSTDAASQVVQQNARYPQPIGTVRAYPMSGGRVGIIVDGSTQNTELAINPLGEPQKTGFAHSFAYGESNRSHVLNVGQITINSGEIGAVLGFQDTELSGPLVSNGTGAIDRIAFESLLPGASITTGGDVNTLDILNGADLSGAGTGVFIGRDLNLLNVGGTLDLSDGAVFSDRPQPWAREPAAQGNGHRIKRPDPQLQHPRGHDNHRVSSTLGRQFHPGQPGHRHGQRELVPDREQHLQHDVPRGRDHRVLGAPGHHSHIAHVTTVREQAAADRNLEHRCGDGASGRDWLRPSIAEISTTGKLQ